MIFLQMITGVLLVILLLIMVLVFNIYIKHWFWYLGIVIFSLLISGCVWILFLDISYALYTIGLFYAVYLYRVYRLTLDLRENQS